MTQHIDKKHGQLLYNNNTLLVAYNDNEISHVGLGLQQELWLGTCVKAGTQSLWCPLKVCLH